MPNPIFLVVQNSRIISLSFSKAIISLLVLIILSSTPNMPIQYPCCQKNVLFLKHASSIIKTAPEIIFLAIIWTTLWGITDTLIRIILWLTCLYQYFYLSLFQPRNTYSWTPVISFPEELMLWCLSSIISIDFPLNLFFCMQHVPIEYPYWVCLLSVPSFAWWSLKFTDLFCCWYNC